MNKQNWKNKKQKQTIQTVLEFAVEKWILAIVQGLKVEFFITIIQA